MTDEGEMHHAIDPSTGFPHRTDVRCVSVLAATGAAAEVLATVSLGLDVAGIEGLFARHDVTGVVVDRLGISHRMPGLEVFS